MYGRMLEMREYGEELKKAGHEITARWIYGNEEDQEREESAIMDYDDVKAADCIVKFAQPYGSLNKGGGRHTELGLALAWGKRCIVVDNKEQIFHWLPQIEYYASWPEVLKVLTNG